MSFVAISKVEYPPHLKNEIEQVGLAMIPIAQAQAGYMNVTFHQSLQRDQTMMIWEWQSADNHADCLNSEQMNQLMKASGALFADPAVSIAIETYEKVE